jgi:hypothetical protein
MSSTEKTEPKEGKGERRRLNYLKERSKELKKEMQAIKTETADLRAKLGLEQKGGAEAKGKK